MMSDSFYADYGCLMACAFLAGFTASKPYSRKAIAAFSGWLLFLAASLTPVTAMADTGSTTETGRPVVTDNASRIISVDHPFTRIISLYAAHTENLYSLGAGNYLVGVSRSESYPEATGQLPWFSYHDDPEKFLAASPDLVLIRPMIDRGYPGLIDRLVRSGITVASLQPGTIDEMYKYWADLGRLTGTEEKAASMIKAFQDRIVEITAITRSIEPKKRVYFEAIHSRMKTFTPGSMALFALKTAGGINVALDAQASRGTNIGNYGKERILSHASEIDIFLAQTGPMNQVTLDMIRQEPGFDVIKAVRENQIYLIDETIVSRPCFRLLLGIRTLGGILYPDVFRQMPEERIF